MQNFFEDLWQNEEYRLQLANTYLTSVIKDDVEFTEMNLRLIRDTASLLLGDSPYLD